MALKQRADAVSVIFRGEIMRMGQEAREASTNRHVGQHL